MNLNLRSAAVLVAGAAVVCSLSSVAAGQTIVRTSQRNPDTNHRYVMISATSWEAADVWAKSRGGSLATIEDSFEDGWLWAIFSPTASKYTIGLRVDSAGNYVWSGGADPGYRNWEPGQPRVTSSSRYTTVVNQKWSLSSTSYVPYYIVEWDAGPIRVPEEYPTLAGAFEAMASSGETRLTIGPGSYTISSPVTLTSGWWSPGIITGAGNNLTQITYTGGVGGVGFVGDWTLKDALWSRNSDTQLFFAKSGFLSLEGLRVSGLFSSNYWGLIQIDPSAQVNVRRSRLRAADSVFGTSGTASVHVSDSVIEDSKVITGGGVRGTFSNCTMVRVGYNGLTMFIGRTRLINSILWNTWGSLGDAVSACNTNFDNYVIPGLGNLQVNPQWNPATYELLEGSSCIDAGSSSAMVGSGLDLTGKPRISGGGPDLGATEFQQTRCEADFNRDGFITFEDFDDFVAAFESGC